MAILKPQDIFVVLKLSVRPGEWSYNILASELYMSASEIHASIARSTSCRLLDGVLNVPVKSSLLEFLEHGLRYVFPPDIGPPTRGMATSYAAEPLKNLIEQTPVTTPVWPDPKGKVRGYSFSPIYHSAPAAAKADPKFYEVLTLTDALRDGQARERSIAIEELRTRLKYTVSESLLSGNTRWTT